jgi:hypothetical protein
MGFAILQHYQHFQKTRKMAENIKCCTNVAQAPKNVAHTFILLNMGSKSVKYYKKLVLRHRALHDNANRTKYSSIKSVLLQHAKFIIPCLLLII